MKYILAIGMLAISLSANLSAQNGVIKNAATQNRAPDISVKSTASGEIVASADYVLQPLDKISFQVFHEPEMTLTTRISADSTIVLYLIGSVDLKNKTLRQAENLIKERLEKDYLVNPQVSLAVLEYAPRYVNMVGQFNSPRKVEFPQEQGLTLIDAITLAGSFTRLADKKHVRVIRSLSNGTTDIKVIDCEKMLNDPTAKNNKDNILLMPNDTITVDEIGIFN